MKGKPSAMLPDLHTNRLEIFCLAETGGVIRRVAVAPELAERAAVFAQRILHRAVKFLR